MKILISDTSKFIPKAIAICVLLGLLWTNAVSYYVWMSDKGHIAAEICDPLDGEGEEKEMEEKLDNKIRSTFSAFQIQAAMLAGKNAYMTDYFLSIHHPEILTPPPERAFVIV